MNVNALDIARQAGHIMLQNGAEISRVEEVMDRISTYYGETSPNFFVLSNGIFATGRRYANVEYIPIHGTQFDKVVAVNQLSRDIIAGRYTLEQAHNRLDEISRMPAHPAWEQILASSIGSAAFCAIFGGSLADCLVSLFAGFFLWLFVLYASARYLTKVFSNILGGMLVTFICIVCYKLFDNVHLGNMIIGAIIPLIPGVPFTNGIRDIAAEDYLAGITRLTDATMVFLCMALGVSITFLIDMHIEGSMIPLEGMLTDPLTAHWLIQLLAAYIGTMAFASLFGVPRKYYAVCGLGGMLGWLTYLLMTRLAGASSVEATFIASLVVVMSTYDFAIVMRCPVSVFLVCGIFPLVPGAGIFWTSYYIVSEQMNLALSTGFTAIKLTFAIVFGIVIITELRRYHLFRKLRKLKSR